MEKFIDLFLIVSDCREDRYYPFFEGFDGVKKLLMDNGGSDTTKLSYGNWPLFVTVGSRENTEQKREFPT